MMTIDRLETQIEKLVERIRNLHFEFSNPELQKEAEDSKEEIIDLLEGYGELATEDWENRPESEDDGEEDESTWQRTKSLLM